MAVYPCAIDGHRYAGQQQSIYFTRLNGAGVKSSKLRLCPRHFEEVEDAVQRHMSPLDDTVRASLVCELCDEPRVESMFARIYRLHEDQQQYCVDLCAAHARAAADACLMSSGEPMGSR